MGPQSNNQNNNQSNTPENTSNNTEQSDGPEALPVLSELLLRVHTELQMHGGYAAQWGVDMTTGFKPSAATRAYTDFLTEVAQDPQVRIEYIDYYVYMMTILMCLLHFIYLILIWILRLL